MILECRLESLFGHHRADIAKRLMRLLVSTLLPFHPVHGTLMVQPTESESKLELDRFIEVMNSIFNEIQAVGWANSTRKTIR